MANPIKRLLGQTAVYGLSSIVGRLLNYLLVPLYTYVFADPADYGVVSELYAWVAFLIVLLTFGMETTYFRFLQDEVDKKKTFNNVLLTVIGINVLFFLILLYFNNDIATFMLYEGHNEYIILLGVIVGIDAITALPLAKLRSEEKALKFASIQFTSILVNIGLNLIFMLYLFDSKRPEEGVLFILIANLCASLVKPLFLMDSFTNLKFDFDWKMSKTMFIYAFPLVIAGFAGIINETLDRILLKQIIYDPLVPSTLHTAEYEVGIYSACYKLAMLVTIILQAYRYAAEPFFFSQMKNENRNLIYVKVMNLFIAFVCLIFLVVSLNIDVFKHFIRNENYWEGLKVVPILLLANVFLGIYYNQSIWYKLSGKTKFGAYIAIGGAIVTVLVNVIFIPKYGYMASAWATLLVYALQMIVSYLLGQKYYPIPYNTRKFLAYIGGAIALFYFGSYLSVDSKVTNFFISNSLIFGYLLFVFLVEQKRFLNGIFGERTF
ncbi:MAG: polysaccharide biosynthesis protein [Flavobacteriales bacterium]|nr:polysaccharide biosynthesis protein [Flavobacteriales bacterium]